MPDGSSSRPAPAPPGGTAPPDEVLLHGERVDVRALATEASARFIAATPAYVERYGEHAAAWCVHDCQHVLSWAFGSEAGYVDLDDQVRWLARVLEARAFPLAWLAADLDHAAGVVAERPVPRAAAVAARLRRAAADVRATPTFLD